MIRASIAPWRLLLSVLVAATVTCHAADAAREASAVVVYRAFFGTLAQLELTASQEEAQGRSGAELRAYYRTEIGLTESEFGPLRSVAASCNARLQEKDAEAKALIQKIRARTPGGKLTSRAELPAAPPELARMQQERDEITQRHIDALSASLGPSSFSKVDAFVKARFSSGLRPAPEPPAGPAATPRRNPPSRPRGGTGK